MAGTVNTPSSTTNGWAEWSKYVLKAVDGLQLNSQAILERIGKLEISVSSIANIEGKQSMVETNLKDHGDRIGKLEVSSAVVSTKVAGILAGVIIVTSLITGIITKAVTDKDTEMVDITINEMRKELSDVQVIVAEINGKLQIIEPVVIEDPKSGKQE